MKKKLIGILICMLLISTTIPAMGSILSNYKEGEKSGCGTCGIILRGPEEAMIGAKINFYWRFLWFAIPWRIIEEDVNLIDFSTGTWPAIFEPYDGLYGCYTFSCDPEKAIYEPPEGTNYYGRQRVDFLLRDGLEIIVFIDVEGSS